MNHSMGDTMTIIVDVNEKIPYHFDFASDGKVAFSVVTQKLKHGDYSLLGQEGSVFVERKSLADLYGTLGKARARFERQLDSMNKLAAATGGYACVVVESPWIASAEGCGSIYSGPAVANGSPFSKIHPHSVVGSIVAWMVQHPLIHWHACGSRFFAEQFTFKLLHRLHRGSHGLERTDAKNHGSP